jgi:hypothetical protein
MSLRVAPSGPKGFRRVLLRRRNTRTIASQALVRVRRMPLWKSSLIALVGLVFVIGIAIGEMALGGVVIHALNPDKSFDIYYALHQQLVVGSLIGMSLLWLCPPHPWAKRLVEATDREQPADRAGEAGAGGPGTVTALSHYQGRAPPLRPHGSEGVGG